MIVVDYGMGNLRSVQKGFEAVGHKVKVSSDPEEIGNADAIVLPGVGAFQDCMQNLEELIKSGSRLFILMRTGIQQEHCSLPRPSVLY